MKTYYVEYWDGESLSYRQNSAGDTEVERIMSRQFFPCETKALVKRLILTQFPNADITLIELCEVTSKEQKQ